MKAIILTEGGKNAGFGHVMRCSVLKSAFEKAGIKTELIVNGADTVSRVLSRGSYIKKDWTNGSTARLTAGADLALIDSYLAGRKTYSAIAAVVKHCLYLDDCARLDYPAGTIINYNAYGPAMRYPVSRGRRCLLGTPYVPLRKEFLPVPGRIISKNMNKVLLMFGGMDKRGLAVQMLNFLAENYPRMEKTVITGSGSRDLQMLRKFKDKNTKIMIDASARQVRQAMLDTDLAFTAGGVTLYELARTGTPGVVFCTAENQKRNSAAMAKAGTVLQAGFSGGRIRVYELKNILSRLCPAGVRATMSRIGRQMVDGLGSARVARYARALILEDKIHLRHAVPGDMLPLFRLSNEPSVRACSINSEKINLAGHKKWFADKLDDPATLFLVAENKGRFAGQVRFAIGKSSSTISISVTRNLRGSGAGGIILKKAMEFIQAGNPGFTVMAYVKPDNPASCKLFQHGGFKKAGMRTIKGVRLCLYRCGGAEK